MTFSGVRYPVQDPAPLAPIQTTPRRGRTPSCQACALAASASSVCLLPEIDGPLKVGGALFIGKAPGEVEDRTGRVFAGSSGTYLRQIVRQYWTGTVIYDNALACFPADIEIDESHITACRPHVVDTIQRYKPSRIVALGQEAMESLFGRAISPFSVRRGYAWLGDVPVFLVLHPAAAVRNRFVRRWFEQDLKWALTVNPRYKPVWNTIVNVVSTPQEAHEAEADLRRQLVEHPEAMLSFDVEAFGPLYAPEYRLLRLALCTTVEEQPWVFSYDSLRDPSCVAVLRALLTDRGIPKAGQNVKYDMQAVFCSLGFWPTPIGADTYLWIKLWDSEAKGGLDVTAEVVAAGGFEEALYDQMQGAKAQARLLATNELQIRPEYQAEEAHRRAADAEKKRDNVLAKTRYFMAQADPLRAVQEAKAANAKKEDRKAKMMEGQPTLFAQARNGEPERVAPKPPTKRKVLDAQAGFDLVPQDEFFKAATLDSLKGFVLESKEKAERWAFAFFPDKDLTAYNGADALVAARLVNVLKPRMTKERLMPVWDKLVGPAVTVTAKMESRGVPVDRERLLFARDHLGNLLMEAKKRLDRYDTTFNPDSNKEIIHLLFDRLGLEPVRTTPEGVPSTKEEDLTPLAREHPIVEDLLEYRRLQKLHGTYAHGMLRYLRSDGRLHPTLNLAGARTGRMACTEPALHGLPQRKKREIASTGQEVTDEEALMVRRCIAAPKGWKLVKADEGQLELRVAAGESRDPEMRGIFLRKEDFHRATARLIATDFWGVDPDKIGSDERRVAKTFVFGRMFGMGDWEMARRLGCTEKEAAKLGVSIMGRFNKLDSYIRKCSEFTTQNGVAWTTWFDGTPFRRRNLFRVGDPAPEKGSRGRNAAKTALRGSWNTPIQGKASDYCLASLINLEAVLESEGLLPYAYPILTIHDAIMLLVKEEAVDEVMHHVHREMTALQCGPDSAPVPLEVDLEVGDTWGDLQKYKLEEK